MSIENYFSDWKARTWTCPRCAWVGTGAQAGTELFTELFEVNCPTCDGRLATIPLPTHDSIRRAASDGNVEAISMLDNVYQAEQFTAERAASRRRLKRLKSIDGDHLEFTLESVDSGDWMNPSHIMLVCNGKQVYKEPSGYEHWEAVIEIGRALLARYGSRVAWYDPGTVGTALLGDNLLASGTIQEFLDAHNIAPPSGPWARTKLDFSE
jgi:hypothetical protein